MKKIAIILSLSALMLLSLAACGDSNDGQVAAGGESGGQQVSAQDEMVIYKLDTVPKPEDRKIPSDEGNNEVSYGWYNRENLDPLNNYKALLEADGFVFSEFAPDATGEEGTLFAEATRGNATVRLGQTEYQVDGVTKYDFSAYIVVEPVKLYANLPVDQFVTLLPELPAAEWYESDFETDFVRWKHYYTDDWDKDTAVNYAAELKNSGYTEKMEEYADGDPEMNAEDNNVYYFFAINEEDVKASVRVDEVESGSFYTTVSIGVLK